MGAFCCFKAKNGSNINSQSDRRGNKFDDSVN